MFLENKYTTIYYKIINKARTQTRVKNSDHYFESHHIIPKSLGGVNTKDNKVLLTFKEHYICHRLLVKMLSDINHINKMKYALYVLCKSNDLQIRNMSYHQKMICLEHNRQASKNRNHKPNLGNKHSEMTKELLRQKSTGRKLSTDAKQKISQNNKLTNKSRGDKNRLALSGKVKSDEHKKKISESIKKKWEERRNNSTTI